MQLLFEKTDEKIEQIQKYSRANNDPFVKGRNYRILSSTPPQPAGVRISPQDSLMYVNSGYSWYDSCGLFYFLLNKEQVIVLWWSDKENFADLTKQFDLAEL